MKKSSNNEQPDIFTLYQSVKDKSVIDIKTHIHDSFFELINDQQFTILEKFIRTYASLDLLLTYTEDYNQVDKFEYYGFDRFSDAIICTNNLELIKSLVNKITNSKTPRLHELLSYIIADGFPQSASKNDIRLLEYYETLHCKYDSRDVKFGLKSNSTNVPDNHVFEGALEFAIDNEYSGVDILEFLLSKKDQYGYHTTKLTVSDIACLLDEERMFYDKADCLRKYLGYDYDSKLFKDVYNIVKNDPRLHPSIPFLVLEKNIEITQEIQELIKGDIRVENVFLYRRLESGLECNTVESKRKI